MTVPEPQAPAGTEPGRAGASHGAASFWSRRKPLVIGFCAGILAAAVAAVVVLVATRPGTQPLRYASLPIPCGAVTAASLAKYMPDASSNPQSMPSSTADQEGACTWSSITGGQDRSLGVQLDVYGTSSGLAHAQLAYTRGASAGSCCKGTTVSTTPVTGLGDQAVAKVITVRSAAGGKEALPGIAVLARSGNADIAVSYSDFPIGSARPALTTATEQAAAVAMARDVLAALANPAAAAAAAAPSGTAAPAASPSPQGPHYAVPPDACTLIRTPTLARYAPGAASKPFPAPSSTVPGTPQLANCGWLAPDASITLNLTVDPDTASALQGYEFAVQYARQGGNGVTFDGAQPVAGVGQRATAVFQTLSIAGSQSHQVTVYAWSGNAEVTLTFGSVALTGPGMSRATELAGATAMTRDVLAGLPR